MQKKRNGTEIVKEMTGGRHWWALKAAAIDAWIDTLPTSTKDYQYGPLASIGEPWDGASDITVYPTEFAKGITITGGKIAHFLDEIANIIDRSQIERIRKPTAADVRVCKSFIGNGTCIVFDIDFIDFIFPVAMFSDPIFSSSISNPSVTHVVSRFMRLFSHVNKQRDAIARKERRLRDALEKTASAFCGDVSPLWLRRSPMPACEALRHFNKYCYNISMIMLDSNLEWTPVSDDSIYTKRDVSNNYSFHFKQQKIRSKKLTLLDEWGSEGFVTEEALSLLIERNVCPKFALDTLRKIHSSSEAIKIDFCNEQLGKFMRLFNNIRLFNGVIEPYFNFENGNYCSGFLTLSNLLPETILACLKGKKLKQIIDHPAFNKSESVVSKVITEFDQIRLKHKVKLHTIESACRIFESQPVSQST